LRRVTLPEFGIGGENVKDIRESLGTDMDKEMSVAELRVGQLVEVLERSWAPLRRFVTVCADFSGFAIGQQFPPGDLLFVNGIRFSIFYSGGARITQLKKSFPPVLCLEMVEDGIVLIDLPVETRRIDLHVMQAAPTPIEIEYFDSQGSLGTVSTTQKDVIEHITLTGRGLKTVSMRNPELLIQKVCYLTQFL
jgi:hypothetical protein